MRVVAGVISGAAGLLWLLFAFMVLQSRFATDPASDPHGYGLIFGSVLAVPAGFVCALTLPFALPRGRRMRATSVAMPAFLIATVVLFVALFTAQ